MPNFPDPERHFDIFLDDNGRPRRRVVTQFPPECAYLAGGLLIAFKVMVEMMDDASRDHAWRKLAYINIYDNLTEHTQQGTGGEGEIAMHQALEVIAQALGVALPQPKS